MLGIKNRKVQSLKKRIVKRKAVRLGHASCQCIRKINENGY